MKALVQPGSIADTPDVLSELTSVPGPSDVVCPNCHTWKSAGERWCENCEEVREALGADPISASFVTLYAKPSNLRDWLTQYKGRPGDEEQEQASEAVIEAIVARFFAEHGDALEHVTGPIDEIVIVPSTDRNPPHPLQLLLERLALAVPVGQGLHRTAEPIGFRQPNARAYRADHSVRGRRILLMDDVYTTGAHLNSAAVALHEGGALVAGALVLARRINPDYRDEARSFWTSATRTAFTWSSGPYITGAPA